MDYEQESVNFDRPAILRKWPSLGNQRQANVSGPYTLADGTLDECIREFMTKPEPSRHLYEIHTAPQPLLVADVRRERALRNSRGFAILSDPPRARAAGTSIGT
jgi:hypothetical protein